MHPTQETRQSSASLLIVHPELLRANHWGQLVLAVLPVHVGRGELPHRETAKLAVLFTESPAKEVGGSQASICNIFTNDGCHRCHKLV
jgi:hypothetical protein